VDEIQAIGQLKQGDIQGLEVLVRLYQLKAIRAAFLITGDCNLAEDIVQKAFLRAAEKIDTFDTRRSFGPWFLRSVVNDAIKAKSKQEHLVPLEPGDGEASIDLFDPTPLPEELVEANETRRLVWQAISQLPAKQRAAIVLHYYLEMPEEEMITELHGPLGTVKWWLYSARQRLRRTLLPAQMIDKPAILDHQPPPDQDQETEEKQ
jgi:RNA polymerase sigma-70 factor, ECF subfamily